MINKSQIKKLLLFFTIAVIVKIFLSFFLRGPSIFPDESCFVQKAIDLVDNLKFRSCSEVSGYESGGEFPFYIFFLSPIYIFLRGKIAYFSVLILQSIISSTLIFPIFAIVKNFIKSDKTAYLLAVVMIFIPQIFAYEKSLMSEFLFIVLNIWSLFFYIKYLDKGKAVSRFMAYLLALLGALTRPFGFILPLAMVLNDMVISKKRKKIIFYFALICAFSGGLVYVFVPEMFGNLYMKFNTVFSLNGVVFLLRALKNQLNSFIIATFFVPLIVFLQFFKKKDLKIWSKLKWFFVFFFTFNFVISAQHIFGYLIDNADLNLLTRYINMSAIYLILLGLIYLSRYKKESFSVKSILVIVVLFGVFLALEKTGKRVQNVELSAFYSIFPTEENRSGFIYAAKYPLIFSYLLMIVFFIKGRFILVRNLLIGLLIATTLFTYKQLYLVPLNTSLTDYVIDHPGSKIVYIVTPEHKGVIHFWKFMGYSDYKIKTVTNLDENNILIDYESLDADLIVSFFDLPGLEVVGTTEKNGLNYKLYRNP